MTKLTTVAGVLVLAGTSSRALALSTDVAAESLNYIDRAICPGYSQLAYSTANGVNFWTEIGRSPTIWTKGIKYTDASVWDTDFVDPQRAAGGNDTSNFDRPGYAISFFSGHGSCNDFAPYNVGCKKDADCASPNVPSGQSLPGACTFGPLQTTGSCFYAADHHLPTCSTYDSLGHDVVNNSTEMKLGESSYSGAWSGAGTNGGINLAIIDNSNTLRSPKYALQSLGPMFAGIRLVGVVMPIGWGADAADVDSRGEAFANALRANPYGTVANAWSVALDNVPQMIGSPCGWDWSTGGGHGIGGAKYESGCGAHFIMSMGDTSAYVTGVINSHNSYDLQDDAKDSKGSGYYSYWYHCNYDCVTYPFSKG